MRRGGSLNLFQFNLFLGVNLCSPLHIHIIYICPFSQGANNLGFLLHIHTRGSILDRSQPSSMFLACGRKTDYPEEMCKNIGRTGKLQAGSILGEILTCDLRAAWQMFLQMITRVHYARWLVKSCTI